MAVIVDQIITTLSRSWDGLRVNVKVHPTIEDFFRSKSEDKTQDVAIASRLWKSKQPLLAYTIPIDLCTFQPLNVPNAQYMGFRLDSLGHRLIHNDAINLSFLRLKGASEDGGVTFVIPGVYGEEGIYQLSKGIEQSAEQFFKSFLKPVSFTTIISTQEKEGGSGGYKEVRQSN